jgi:nitroreductase
MDFLELAKERYSVRKFSEKKVEKESAKLEREVEFDKKIDSFLKEQSK